MGRKVRGTRPFVCSYATNKQEARREFEEWQRTCYQTKDNEMPSIVEITKDNYVVWYKMDTW